MMNLTYENINKTKSSLDYPAELFINGKYQKSISEYKVSLPTFTLITIVLGL